MIELDIWFTQFGVRTQKLCKSQVSDSCCAKAAANPTPLPSTSFLATRPLGTPNVPLCTGYTRKYKRYVWKAFTMDRTATTRSKTQSNSGKPSGWFVMTIHYTMEVDWMYLVEIPSNWPSNSARWTQATDNRLQEAIRNVHQEVGARWCQP